MTALPKKGGFSCANTLSQRRNSNIAIQQYSWWATGVNHFNELTFILDSSTKKKKFASVTVSKYAAAF